MLHHITTYPLDIFLVNETAPTEIYALSLHDALPIWHERGRGRERDPGAHRRIRSRCGRRRRRPPGDLDRKSTRLNSSHVAISYAVFCLKKKNRCRGTVSRRGKCIWEKWTLDWQQTNK